MGLRTHVNASNFIFRQFRRGKFWANLKWDNDNIYINLIKKTPQLECIARVRWRIHWRKIWAHNLFTYLVFFTRNRFFLLFLIVMICKCDKIRVGKMMNGVRSWRQANVNIYVRAFKSYIESLRWKKKSVQMEKWAARDGFNIY